MRSKIKKIILFSSLLIIIFSLLLAFLNIKFDYQANKIKYKDQFQNKIFPYFISLPDKLKSTLMIFTGKRSFNNLFNDYNVKFLPETEYIKLDLKKFKTSFEKSLSKSFFIEIFKDDLFIVSKSGEFYKANLTEIENKEIKNLNEKKVLNDLKKDNINFVINDIHIIEDKIFVLKASEDNPANNNCGKLEIYYSNIKDVLKFDHFKTFNECVGAGIVAGGMQGYSFNNKTGLLISTVSSGANPETNKSQNDDSVFGKVIFVDFETKEVIRISKGHRNPQGLAVNGDIILSTEHGPKGGDEVNKIIYGKNYGWPVASYGLPYPTEKNFKFKNHEDHSFQEPVYVFLSAIGISELIFLPNSFHPKWKDNVIVSSLNGRSLFRIKFSDEKYDKVLYVEKIFIGERIRDIKYSFNQNFIVLALEDTGVIGILEIKDI